MDRIRAQSAVDLVSRRIEINYCIVTQKCNPCMKMVKQRFIESNDQKVVATESPLDPN